MRYTDVNVSAVEDRTARRLGLCYLPDAVRLAVWNSWI